MDTQYSVDIKDAAIRLGVTVSRVHQLIDNHLLKAAVKYTPKLNGNPRAVGEYMVTAESLEARIAWIRQELRRQLDNLDRGAQGLPPARRIKPPTFA